MPVEKTERDITTLMGEISRREIKLPEIQRGYIWKPTQVARLIESLYRGYPTGPVGGFNNSGRSGVRAGRRL